MKHIYLDHAAATPMSMSVRRAMVRAMGQIGNPSSYNDVGRQAAEALAGARSRVARFLGTHPHEIIFTASGSEANALALRGISGAYRIKTIVTTPIEHLSVLENAKMTGCKIMHCAVDRAGRVNAEDVKQMFRDEPMIVSVMYANNEIGTIEPIAHVGKMIRAFRKEHGSVFPLFHVDACQGAPYLPMRVDQLGVDLLTMNGSKVYGPRGVGILYVRQGLKIKPLVGGGGQEHGARAGTENVPAIVGIAQALDEIPAEEGTRLASIRDYFFKSISDVLPDVRINGALAPDRLPNNIHISIPGLDSENLLLELDKRGIHAGSGSACTARSVKPSHVLKAIGVRKPYLDGALRFSLGRSTTKNDIDVLLKALPEIVGALKKRYGK